ncbi:MAG TPA: SDR family oxidoreductase [Polyangium sp.]|nr:SDR family oxidoreductase [Polyangium sp.]
MSLVSALKGNGPSGFGYGSTAEQVTEGLDLRGKTMLVTGCNSGLGLETVRVLAKRGAHVIGTARTVAKAEEAGKGLTAYTPLACELSEPSSVRACVKSVLNLDKPIDAIIANAGIMALPKLEQKFGYELQFFTNHIGHFILVTGLLDKLSDTARVVVVSSGAHGRAPKEGIEFDNLSGERGYEPWRNYGQSKFANILFARELARKFAGTNKTANSLHPGVIQTNLGRHMGVLAGAAWAALNPIMMKSIPQGSATQCYVATHPSLARVTGEYFVDCNVGKSRRLAESPELAKKLWTVSEEIVAKV